MFGGKSKAVIAGRDREIESLERQLTEVKRERTHLREQLDRVYHAALNLPKSSGGINRPAGSDDNAVG